MYVLHMLCLIAAPDLSMNSRSESPPWRTRVPNWWSNHDPERYGSIRSEHGPIDAFCDGSEAEPVHRARAEADRYVDRTSPLRVVGRMWGRAPNRRRPG